MRGRKLWKNEVDEPRAFYTEWGQKRKQIYINTHIWNLEGWYWWIYVQSSNGDTDMENRLMDKGRGEEEEGEINGDSSMDAYTLTYVSR